MLISVFQAVGTVNEADINSDINLMIDPEASKIALAADFPSIVIAGNVANQVISSQEFLDEIYEVKNPYSDLMYNYYGTTFPFWDETAMGLLIDPTLNTNSSTGNFSSTHEHSKIADDDQQSTLMSTWPMHRHRMETFMSTRRLSCLRM